MTTKQALSRSPRFNPLDKSRSAVCINTQLPVLTSARKSRSKKTASQPARGQSLTKGLLPLNFQVRDVSEKGMGLEIALADLPGSFETFIKEGRLDFRKATLQIEGQEMSLGKLDLRHHRVQGDRLIMGFFCEDDEIPVFTDLRSLLAEQEVLAIGGKTGNRSFFDYGRFARYSSDSWSIEDKCKLFYEYHHSCFEGVSDAYFTIREKVSNKRKVDLASSSTVQGNRDLTCFASYDYLGLSQHPLVVEVFQQAARDFGLSSGGAAVTAGTTILHRKLEEGIAKALGKEDAITFSSGYAANLGVIGGMLGQKDMVIYDQKSHASIQEAIRHSPSKAYRFRHNQNKDLQHQLREHRFKHAGGMTITEGLFSMDGDIPDLAEFHRLSKEYKAHTFIDEAHSFGVLGPNGLGACAEAGVLDDWDIFMATFSKGLGCSGGFVAGSKEMVQWLRYYARSGMFSGSMMPAVAAASLTAFNLSYHDSQYRDRLQTNIGFFREKLISAGFDLKSHPTSPVISILVGDIFRLQPMYEALLDKGVLVTPIVYPAVAKDASIFRFSMSSLHSFADIEKAVDALIYARNLVSKAVA